MFILFTILLAMGNKKNAYGGKCRKKPPSKLQHIQQQYKPDSGLGSSSRIINLQHLANYIAEVTSHAASCTSCTGSGGDAVTLVCEKNRQGLASILVAQCGGCGKEFPISTSKYAACQMVMFDESATLPLCGVRWQLAGDTARYRRVCPRWECL